ncbi:signal peptidase I [Streptacidiphilus sp. MAP12-16]|uniref:signal peptidase I n=1 Tax=Streptacidiphilus sp. MAP12-16 TaxID=3156300 RepID=UPI0035198366
METQQAPEDRDCAPEPEGRGARSRSSAVRRLLRDLGLLGGICALVLVLVNAFVAQPFVIPSGSMEGALRIGDRVVVDKLAYRFSAPQRGDVVVFDGRGSFVDAGVVDAGDGSGDDFVKRVIGVGGDTVTCCDTKGRLSVDGVPLDEGGYLYPGDAPSAIHFSIKVPAGRLFVLGDHRSVSRDSRDHLGEPGGGMVPVDKVTGRVDWVVFPLGHWRSLDRPHAFAVLTSALSSAALSSARSSASTAEQWKGAGRG